MAGAIPFCVEYPGPRFEDKFRSANQMDGISKAGGDKMADSEFVSKRTCEIQCDRYGQKCSPQILGNKEDIGIPKRTTSLFRIS